MRYVCSECGDEISSGAGELVNNGEDEKELVVEDAVAEKKSYLFLGSSITNGYDPTVPNPSLDSSHYSMAEMFEEDSLRASYKVYRDGALREEEDVYFCKIEGNDGEVAGTYRYDHDEVTLNADGTGEFNGTAFRYTLVGMNEIRLEKPVGYLYAFNALYKEGDTVYKYARDGYTLSYAEVRYTANGEKVQNAYHQSYVGLLKEAVERIGDKQVDTMFVQLSTNDIGQYKTPAGSAGEHLDFGAMTAEDVRDPSAFDVDTSFGALEWIIATAQQTWDCNVVTFVCHMDTAQYAAFEACGYDYSKMDDSSDYALMRSTALEIAEKWDLDVIDFWGDADSNKILHGDAARYLADSLHLHRLGYERVLWQAFRRYADGLASV